MTSQARSLLFLSCDIVGSTEYKQRNKLWQRTFLSFYREFPQLLGQITREKSFARTFTLWKAVGDELIFTVDIRNEQDVYWAVKHWLEAMSRYEDQILVDHGLATKGGAFIATFPGPDSESTIPIDPQTEVSDKGVFELNAEALAARSDDYLYDYFGPSIDTGFRVIGSSSRRHFTLSVEVAWAMAKCAAEAGVAIETFPLADLVFLGNRQLKGVWGGREYPLLALDRLQLDRVNLAIAALSRSTLDARDVVNLCRECSTSEGWPSQLYLPDSAHTEFHVLPTDSLAPIRSNSMEGAETVPTDAADTSGDVLADDAPLGDRSPDATDVIEDVPQQKPED